MMLSTKSSYVIKKKITTFGFLKKLIAILFLVSFTMGNTELHEIFRLPVLFHHFMEHRQQEPQKSFADFLSQHYSVTQSHPDNSHHDHDKLPFKTKDCPTGHILLAIERIVDYTFFRPTFYTEKISPIYKSDNYYSAIVDNIWQPPKYS